jgi:hypothetical protein
VREGSHVGWAILCELASISKSVSVFLAYRAPRHPDARIAARTCVMSSHENDLGYVSSASLLAGPSSSLRTCVPLVVP